MRPRASVLTLLAFLVAALAAQHIFFPAHATSQAVTITVSSAGFEPQYPTIHAGDSVIWWNIDGQNHAVMLDGSNSPFHLDAGASIQMQFPVAGNVHFWNADSPGLAGVIAVLESTSSVAYLPYVEQAPTPEPPTATALPTTTPEPTATILPTATPIPTAAPTTRPSCDPSYPTVCIPPPPPDLDCGDIPYRRFTVLPPDPHDFDGNGDGVGCET